MREFEHIEPVPIERDIAQGDLRDRILDVVKGVAFGFLIALVLTSCVSSYPIKDADLDHEYRVWRTHLYASTTLDAATTIYGLHDGASEANPVMASIADNEPVFLAVQYGIAYGIDYLAKRDCYVTSRRSCLTVMKFLVGFKYAVGAWNLYQVAK